MKVNVGDRVKYDIEGFGNKYDTGIVKELQDKGWMIIVTDKSYSNYFTASSSNERRIHSLNIVSIIPS